MLHMATSTHSTITIRLPNDLKKQVEKAAEKDERSLTMYIIRALREKLARG